ncbi:MAG: glutathione S-transferase N-terminal domain-containing protein, partial [Pseudomonadota bacterium]
MDEHKDARINVLINALINEHTQELIKKRSCCLMAEALTVYEHPLSPYAQKVKLALLEKGLTFNVVNLAAMDPA